MDQPEEGRQPAPPGPFPPGTLPPGVAMRPWTTADFPAVQALFTAEGWHTPRDLPAAALAAWQRSSPALVATAGDTIVGLLRALSDGAMTVYVAELLVHPAWRGRGLATALLAEAQRRNPGARLDLLAETAIIPYYARLGFRPYQGYRLGWRDRAALTSAPPTPPVSKPETPSR